MQIVHKKSAPLEEKQRLSRSILWQLQRDYYDRQGIAAWSTGAVPHHITSSPFIADAYARIALGFLRDCQANTAEGENSSLAQLDRSQPVYIVELGSGSGRFAYLFLKKFVSVYGNSVLKNNPVKFIMTDFTERTAEYWRAHPRLKPFIEAGWLDFARFDVEHGQELRLINSGDILTAETLRNPLVVISNYLFDSIPQDAFFIAEGQLFETLVTVTTSDEEPDPDNPEMLARIEVAYLNNLIDGDYYDDPEWNRILLDYKQRLPGTPFLFPIAALQCIQNIHSLAGGRMFMLSGDRGYSRDEALLQGHGTPTMAMHAGAFSMMVDYQIIGEYCRHLGGQVLHPAHGGENLNISAFIFGDSPGGFVETRQAYAEAIEKFGPDDFFTLKSGVAQVYETLNLAQLLAFLRLSGWDYKRFWECLPAIKNHLPEISEIQKQQLYETIQHIWDLYLPIGEEHDLAFQLGTLLLELEFYPEALKFLQHSVDLYGMEPGTAYNTGVCYYSLGQMDKAREFIDQALELDPELDVARTMRIRLEPSLRRAPL